MISSELKKFITKLTLVSACYLNYANGCVSNGKLYSEIGCTPVYGKNSDSCPVAYDCDNVFTRPKDKCYFNGNVYEPSASLSKSDSALVPCLASCFCNQKQNNNINETSITCARVVCPSSFSLLQTPCYYEYDRDSCCEVKSHCPAENSNIFECTYGNNTYKKGERIHIGSDIQCVCSEIFNGTASDASCRKLGCNSEIDHVAYVLKRSAPIFFEKLDGCPFEWYHSDYNAVVNPKSLANKSGDAYVCSYGNSTFAVGQNVTIANEEKDTSPYKTTCSCNIPPLITCIRAIRQ